MKITIYLKQLLAAIFCCLGLSLSAQTSVGSFAGFDAAFQGMKAAGGTINLTANITIDIAQDDTYDLSSTGNVTINTGAYQIIANGPDGSKTTTENNAVLKVDGNVTILGDSTIISTAGKSIVWIAGGLIKSTPNGNTGTFATVYSNGGGAVKMTGGTVSMDATNTGAANPFVFYMNNFMNLETTGGTIEYTGAKAARVIRVGTSATASLSGITINIDSENAGTYAIFTNSGRIDIGSNVTVNAPNSTALVVDGANALIVIDAAATNITLNANTLYSGSGGIFDLRTPLTITSDPANGNAFTDPDNVTFTITGNEELNRFGNIYYTMDGSEPTTSSTILTSGSQVAVSNADNTIKARIGKAGYFATTTQTFTYTVQNAVPVTYISNLAELETAMAGLSTPGSSKWMLSDNIVVNKSLTLVPDETHPVELDANGKYLQSTGNGNTIAYGGNLTINSTAGIFKLNDQTTTQITGGTYTVTDNAPIIYANTGSGISNTATKLYLSDATFTADGTNNSARIINMVTSDGNLITAKNCIFNISDKGLGFAFVGPQEINIKDCIINVSGSGTSTKVFSQSPTNAVNRSDLTINGTVINMQAGDVFTWGGNKNINTVLQDLTLNGNATIAKPAGGTGEVRNFYDFRAYDIEAAPEAGTYSTPQDVELTLKATGISPEDAEGAVIVYTLNGSEPVASSVKYSAAIPVSDNTTIKVAVLKDGFLGATAEFKYEFPTGLTQPGIENTPYIAANILYLNKPTNSVALINVSGQIVLQASDVELMDVSSLANGIYIVKTEGDVYKVVK